MPHPDRPSSERRSANPTVDHLTPLVRGGRDVIENRVACCDACNQAKGPLDAQTFLRVRLNRVMLNEERRRCGAEMRSAARDLKNAGEHAGR